MRRMHTHTISKEASLHNKNNASPFDAYFKLSPLALSVVLALNTLQVQANPTDGQVVGGKATINQTSPNRLNITQTTNRAIIDWKSFSIGKNEQVNFNQPNANATILNRVTGNEVSSILGGLTANGKVFLVNPNGIYFGKGAQVNVGSLIASTANISNQNFMNGNLVFDQPGKAGAKIINEGNISIADAGIAAFVAPDVRNTGSIIAKLGKVSLAAGAAYSIDLYGDNLINLIVDEATLASLKDTSGTPLKLYVEQAGLIDAQGGYVQLSSGTAKQLVDGIINMSGVTQVGSVSQQGGKISLNAGPAGTVNIAGTLDASSQTNTGGQITVTGQDVHLSNTAKLSSTGTQGGEILIGGDYQGKGKLANAQTTNIEAGAVINAGEQGRVIAWSDNRTSFAGEILAKNGFVEVSGKEHLNFDGKVTANTLLLDPKFIVIDDNSNISKGNQSFYDISVLKTSTINNNINTVTNFSLLASDSIYLNSAITGTVAGHGLSMTAQTGSVYLNSNITTNNGAVTINAGKDILAANGTTIDTRNGTSRGGNVTLEAGRDIVTNFLYTNDFTATAGRNITLAQGIGGNDASNPQIGKVDIQADGNLTLNGINANGSSSGNGLTVIAGGTITSNYKIAVNDGALQFGDATHQNSMILKDSIYSRNGYAIDVWPTLTLAIGETLTNCFANISACSDTSLYASLPKNEITVTDSISGQETITEDNNLGLYRQLVGNYISVPKVVISNNSDSLSPNVNSGDITIHNAISNAKADEKILLKLVSFVDANDKTTIGISNIDDNTTNKIDVKNLYSYDFIAPGGAFATSTNVDNLPPDMFSLTLSDQQSNIEKLTVTLNSLEINTLQSTSHDYISVNNLQPTFEYSKEIVLRNENISEEYILVRTNVIDSVGQIYKTENGVSTLYYTSNDNSSTNKLSTTTFTDKQTSMPSSSYHYALSFYDGFLGTVGATASLSNGQAQTASAGSAVGGGSSSSSVSFNNIGNSITGNLGSSFSTPAEGGNQFLNSANQDQSESGFSNSANGADYGSSGNIQVVMGDNMANQADFGRGAGVGATNDVFDKKYCVVAPGDAATANQAFFGGCN